MNLINIFSSIRITKMLNDGGLEENHSIKLIAIIEGFMNNLRFS